MQCSINAIKVASLYVAVRSNGITRRDGGAANSVMTKPSWDAATSRR